MEGEGEEEGGRGGGEEKGKRAPSSKEPPENRGSLLRWDTPCICGPTREDSEKAQPPCWSDIGGSFGLDRLRVESPWPQPSRAARALASNKDEDEASTEVCRCRAATSSFAVQSSCCALSTESVAWPLLVMTVNTETGIRVYPGPPSNSQNPCTFQTADGLRYPGNLPVILTDAINMKHHETQSLQQAASSDHT